MRLLADVATQHEQVQFLGDPLPGDRMDPAPQVLSGQQETRLFPEELHRPAVGPMISDAGDFWPDERDTPLRLGDHINHEKLSLSDQLRWYICYIIVY
jgi:hypothetical protein